jgi:hypothetical protein
MTAVIVPKAPRMGPYLRRSRCSRGAMLAAAICVAQIVSAADAAETRRFPLRDRGPFNGIVGIGDLWPDPDGPAVELSWDIASHAMAEQAGGETLILDGETHIVTLRVQRQFAGRASLAVELPWLTHGGGFMDDVIDAWHDAFGLAEGIRPSLPTGDLRYSHARGDVEVFRLDDTTSGIGDLRTSGAWRIAGGPAGIALDLVAEIEWPTGDAGRLTGSGGTDVAAGLRLASRGGRLGWSLGAGVAWPGEVDLPLPAAAGSVWYGDAALAWTAWPTFDVIVQAAGHGGAWESGLDALGGTALQFGGGFVWQLAPRYRLRFGVFEDIRTDTTPDFATELALVYTLD